MKPLHYKKHTLAKRGLSLLCVLALCLGLLPVTALAADTNTVYVGGVTLAGSSDNIVYATTNESGEVITNDADANNYNIKWDGNTLTLKGAYITKEVSTPGLSSPVEGAAIGVYNQSGDANLTITLEGTNTIKDVSAAIHVFAPSGSASLTITGDGILSASSGYNPGIRVQSNTGNGTLAITGAKVTASSSYSGNGVQIRCGDSSNASLTVNGGSLTATGSGATFAGIIMQFGSSTSGSGTPTVTVSDNAIVRANGSAGGITSNSSAEVQTAAGTGESGGIVFDNGTGTVYGKVKLQEDLEIGEGESLTIGQDASLNTGNHEVIVNGGTITGQVNGQQSPQITALPQSQTVTEGESATFTIEASGSESLSYQWQKSTNGSDWTNIGGATSATYAITNTTKDMSGTQYRCVVTGSGVSVISSAATLTVNALTTYTINATANPAEGGTVTVNGGETSATVTEGSEATLTATVNEGWRFAGWMENGQLVSNETTYTITANGNRTLTAEFEKVYNVTVNSTAGGTATADKTTAAEGETVTLTATPNSGYHFAGWNVVSGTVTIQDKQFIMPANDVDIQAIFARNTSPTIPPTVSEKTIDAIQDAEPGERVTVDLSHGSTKLDKEVFETLAGKDITLAIDLGDGVSWTVNGTDISADADLSDLDLGVTMNSDGIPVDLINAITGEHGSVQMTLAHNGDFGFTMTLTAPLGAENAGYWANLYHFEENDGEAGKMTFETAAKIGDDGSVSLPLSHASQYAIVIDDHNHGVVTLPFTDVADSDWFYDPVCFVYSQGLMTGTSENTFEPNTHLSRAMLVAVLHRLEGSPAASGGDFTDVADGDWYAQAVNWAASVGVVNGFDDGTFQPNTAISREQLAAILRNYAQYKGLDVSASGDLSIYTDANSVSDWAKESVTWAVGEGLLSGMTVDTLEPQGLSTRAQVAAVLQRYLAN